MRVKDAGIVSKKKTAALSLGKSGAGCISVPVSKANRMDFLTLTLLIHCFSVTTT